MRQERRELLNGDGLHVRKVLPMGAMLEKVLDGGRRLNAWRKCRSPMCSKRTGRLRPGFHGLALRVEDNQASVYLVTRAVGSQSPSVSCRGSALLLLGASLSHINRHGHRDLLVA